MKKTAIIERGKAGSFSIFAQNTESVIIGTGASVAEAKFDFENSLKEIISAYAEAGLVLPEELDGVEFEYKYDVASVFDYFKFINISQFAKIAGISPSLMRHYKLGDTYISENQARKIEQALHGIGRELLTVSL